MAEIRSVTPLKSEIECDGLHIQDYELEEVVIPALVVREDRPVIRIVARGRNFQAVAQPLFIRVGNQTARFLQISPDERSVEGVLLEEPEANSPVEVMLGDLDGVRHPQRVDPGRIKRITNIG